MLPALLLAFALSILVAVLATTRGASVPLALAAGLFALQVLFALARINEPLWRTSRGRCSRCRLGVEQYGACRARLCLGRHCDVHNLLAIRARLAALVAVRRRHGAVRVHGVAVRQLSDEGSRPSQAHDLTQRPHGRDGRTGHRGRGRARLSRRLGQAANGEGGLGSQSHLHHRRHRDRADFHRLATGASAPATQRRRSAPSVEYCRNLAQASANSSIT